MGTKRDDELDLTESVFNPMAQPDKRFMALAGAALPVLLERAGGSATFSQADFDEVNRRYGGRVAVHLERTSNGDFRAWLVPSQKGLRRPS